MGLASFLFWVGVWLCLGLLSLSDFELGHIMATNTVYLEKLKDPRWQKKRLEIFERDEWACQRCGDKKTTLHVHHTCYKKGRTPWDYEGHQLLTLCEDCHSNEHDGFLIGFIQTLIKDSQENGVLLFDIASLLVRAKIHPWSKNRLQFSAKKHISETDL